MLVLLAEIIPEEPAGNAAKGYSLKLVIVMLSRKRNNLLN
ncbi:hypothetical protein JCM19294_2425 [Nonlabens tegetincola]|uniref:Uncharacterized protein n=1 Tax=Nonlabens tegetincola TaxID=323273 RepID=A0A090Q1N9_9FLAO|nr:hypothetical protein JCM19294_2425 [Nonlabens tegetincola]